MVKLLKDKIGIEVSESTIRRALQEHCKSMNIVILNLKYAQKMLEKSNKKIRLVLKTS